MKKTLIKKFDEYVNESHWSEMNRRSQGIIVRKEEQIKSNVKDMIPVDLGLSVLWADRNLEINDETEFLIENVRDYEPDGWRRPTRKEADELLKCKWTSNKDQLTPTQMKSKGYEIIFYGNGNELIFNGCQPRHYEEFFERENTHESDEWSTFAFMVDHTFLPQTVYGTVKLDETAKVRFVKDK
jgi:hypothetical protein